MEGLSPLHRRVAGIDVHRMLHVVTVLIEQPDGSVNKHRREFGGFKRDCRALAAWLAELQIQLAEVRHFHPFPAPTAAPEPNGIKHLDRSFAFRV